MLATILVDNIEYNHLTGEWGLSVYIEYNGKKILLDTGASELFIANAEKLGIDISDVDIAVLSHAHYDHGNGMQAFFEKNQKAKMYISAACRENCYGYKAEIGTRYIGLPEGVLERFASRIVRVSGKTRIADGITLLSHSTPNLHLIGERDKLYIDVAGEFVPDNFEHEHSLIFESDKGLVVFNSCCHAGAGNILREVKRAFPEKTITAIVGGFHLYKRSEEEVRRFADDVRKCDIQRIYTGHCTGLEAYEILKQELGNTVCQLRCGLKIEW